MPCSSGTVNPESATPIHRCIELQADASIGKTRKVLGFPSHKERALPLPSAKASRRNRRSHKSSTPAKELPLWERAFDRDTAFQSRPGTSRRSRRPTKTASPPGRSPCGSGRSTVIPRFNRAQAHRGGTAAPTKAAFTPGSSPRGSGRLLCPPGATANRPKGDLASADRESGVRKSAALGAQRCPIVTPFRPTQTNLFRSHGNQNRAIGNSHWLFKNKFPGCRLNLLALFYAR